VPGVTSALAVPASANIPVTLRKVSRAVAVVTAQSEDGRGADGLNYDALVGMETIVVLMGLANLREVVERLVAAGRDPHTPAACIERGTMPQQRVVTGNLETIANLADQAQLESPTTTVIGEVVRQAALCPADLDQTSIPTKTPDPLPRSADSRAASA
jgi:siroheme synthase